MNETSAGEWRFSYCAAGDYLSECTGNNGNPRSQTINPLGVTQSYGFDGLNRVKTFVEPGLRQTYVYDRWGNRALLSGTANSNYVPEWPPAPVVTADDEALAQAQFSMNRWTAATPDGAGNLLRPKSDAYPYLEYDGENRVKLATTGVSSSVVFEYDGEGRRVKKTSGASTTYFVYDAAGRLAAEYGAASAESGRRYVTSDYLGSMRAVTDEGGLVTRRADYTPFGDWLLAGAGGRSAALKYEEAAATGEWRQRFTGKERDGETGLDYFGARYMSSAQGRFTSADEPLIDQQADDPQSWNLYGYVRNNPLRFIDPTGQACVVRSNGSEYDDDSGGQSCADVKKENRNLKPSATVTGEPGNVVAALALNTLFAVDNAANDYFRFLTDAIGVQPSYMQNTPTNEGVTGNVASAAVFVGTALNPRGLLTNTRTRLLQSAQNPKLRNIIGNLYRPGAAVGTGSTADAIRSELATGVLLSPKGHFLKGVESRTALQRLYRDASLGASDKQIVKELLIDLQSALSGR